MPQSIPQPPQALIFDLDGTLADTEAAWSRAKSEVGASVGVQIASDRVDSYMGQSVMSFLRGELPDQAAQHDDLAQDVGRLARAYLPQVTRAMPGAVALVRQVQALGLPMAVCSSSAPDLIDSALERIGLSDAIDIRVSGFALPRGKPDPMPYVETLRLLACPAERALAFEDSPTGVRSATGAGIGTIGLGDQLGEMAAACAICLPDLSHARDLIGSAHRARAMADPKM